MPDVLVRGLTPAVVKRLKARAKSRGRSLQAEVKDILEREARLPNDILEGIRRVRAMTRGKRFDDSTLLIREDRER